MAVYVVYQDLSCQYFVLNSNAKIVLFQFSFFISVMFGQSLSTLLLPDCFCTAPELILSLFMLLFPNRLLRVVSV